MRCLGEWRGLGLGGTYGFLCNKPVDFFRGESGKACKTDNRGRIAAEVKGGDVVHLLCKVGYKFISSEEGRENGKTFPRVRGGRVGSVQDRRQIWLLS